MAEGPDPARFQELNIYFENIIKAIIPLFGIVSLIMLLSGGFTFLTSSGNPENQQKAQKTITFAVVGIIMAIGAWLILFTIQELTGANVTEFNFQTN